MGVFIGAAHAFPCATSFKRPIDTSSSDTECGRDLRHRATLSEEFYRLVRLEPRRRPRTKIAVLGFCLCNPLALPLKHDLAFELCEAGEDGENVLASLMVLDFLRPGGILTVMHVDRLGATHRRSPGYRPRAASEGHRANSKPPTWRNRIVWENVMPRDSERSLAIRPIDLIYSVRELRGGEARFTRAVPGRRVRGAMLRDRL